MGVPPAAGERIEVGYFCGIDRGGRTFGWGGRSRSRRGKSEGQVVNSGDYSGRCEEMLRPELRAEEPLNWVENALRRSGSHWEDGGYSEVRVRSFGLMSRTVESDESLGLYARTTFMGTRTHTSFTCDSRVRV